MTEWDLAEAFGKADGKFIEKTARFFSRRPTWRCVMKKSVKFAVTAAAVVLTVGVIAVAMFLQNRPATMGGVGSPGEGSGQKLRVCIDIGGPGDTDSGVGQQNKFASGFLQYLENKSCMEKEFP